MDELSTIIILLILIILAGVFSSLEIAFFSLSDAKIRVMIKKKKSGALLVQKLKSNPERLLTTILIGSNLFNILSASIATAISINLFGSSGIAIASFLLTIIFLMFVDILPKSIASSNSEIIVSSISYPLYFFQLLISPIVFIFEKSSNSLLKLFNIKRLSVTSDEELKAMAKIGFEEGSIEKNEQLLIRNALRFNDIEVGQIMTPRVKMISLEENETIFSSIEIIKDYKFSRIPIYSNNADNITGIFYTKEIFSVTEEDYKNKKLKFLSNKPLFTTESKKIDDLFLEFKNSRVHIAVVLDEHGGTAGIITLEDIIEELVGEIDDETDEDLKLIKRVDKDTLISSGQAEIKYIADFFEVDEFNSEEITQTVNGFIIAHNQDIPEQGYKVIFNGLEFTILKASEKIIEEVKISRYKN